MNSEGVPSPANASRLVGNTARPSGLSICIPVYNKGALLGRTLESIRRQEIADLEVVALNNASTDNSLEVLESWRGKLNLAIYSLPRTISLPDNWLLAISLGTREFLKLQLADDVIPDGTLAKLLETLRSRPEIGFAIGNSSPIDPHGNIIKEGVLHQYWSSVNQLRRKMALAKSMKEKAECLAGAHFGSSAFGDANSIIFRSALLSSLRCGVNKLSTAFLTWPEYEINLRLFAAAEAGYVDIPCSYFSYDEHSSIPKIHSTEFRRRAHDIPAFNIFVMLLLDPDLKPLTKELSKFFFLKLFLWHVAKGISMMLGRK